MAPAPRACTGALLAAGIFSVLGIAIADGEPGRSSPERPMPHGTIADVLVDQTDRLLSVPGVVGVALGRCAERPCIKVLVERKTAEVLREIPSTLGGYPVSIEDTGEFRAHDR